MRRMLFTITKDIAGFFIAYAPMGCLLAGIVVLCCWLWMAFCGKKTTGKNDSGRYLENQSKARWQMIWRLVLIFLLAFYLYMILGITILSRSETATREISFELFRTFRNTFTARKQVYENVVMFVPFSILLYALAEPFRKLWISLAVGAAGSLLIEVTQWLTMTGHFEVDDILTNTIGTLIGYVLCVVVHRMVKRIIR